MYLRRTCTVIVAAASLCALAGAAPEAEEKTGRFVMTPVEGGFLRMDTQTGAVSMCQRMQDKWSCELVADDRRSLDREIERLGQENRELSRRLDEAQGKQPGDRGSRLQLPSEEDVDSALNYMQRLMRKFKEKLRELEADKDGRSL